MVNVFKLFYIYSCELSNATFNNKLSCTAEKYFTTEEILVANNVNIKQNDLRIQRNIIIRDTSDVCSEVNICGRSHITRVSSIIFLECRYTKAVCETKCQQYSMTSRSRFTNSSPLLSN